MSDVVSSVNALRFDDRFVRSLPPDPARQRGTRQVRGACYSHVEPTPVSAPKLLAWSKDAAHLLDWSEDLVRSPEVVEALAGNRLLPGMVPYAACYGGHQFGHWAGQLGDGRAITLGEVINGRGERWELQLKGAGPTPYSRQADGRAVLRSSLREFLCSEAMHHLGVPTTRALSLVTTGDLVVRDMFYDGHPRPEPGAIVCRLAPSFLRFGNYQIHASRGEIELLRKLVDFTIETYFPSLGPVSEATYARWFAEVCRRTAVMVAHWMRVGFVHGVMNTDNMSILGLTIDYGPYGWLDDYDPSWTPNTTDAAGRRYAYGRQPEIAEWNLVQLARAVHGIVPISALEEGLDEYRLTFERGFEHMLAHKIGLETLQGEDDGNLVADLFGVLQLVETDMTIFFRALAEVPTGHDALSRATDGELLEPLARAFYAPEDLTDAHRERLAGWLRRYLKRLVDGGIQDEARRTRMSTANPKYVLRNYLAQEAIDAAQEGDTSRIETLLEVLRRPYDEQPEHDELAAKRPEWARRRPGCSALSCSS